MWRNSTLGGHTHHHSRFPLAFAGTLLAVALFVGSFIFMVYVSISQQSGLRAEAQSSFSSFLQTSGIPFHSATCVDGDTDGDGYVSCTQVTLDGNPIAWECAAGWTTNSGCRLQQAKMRAIIGQW